MSAAAVLAHIDRVLPVLEDNPRLVDDFTLADAALDDARQAAKNAQKIARQALGFERDIAEHNAANAAELATVHEHNLRLAIVSLENAVPAKQRDDFAAIVAGATPCRDCGEYQCFGHDEPKLKPKPAPRCRLHGCARPAYDGDTCYRHQKAAADIYSVQDFPSCSYEGCTRQPAVSTGNTGRCGKHPLYKFPAST